MNTFVINQTPFERGLRPRGFFPERKKMFQGLSFKTYDVINYDSSSTNEKIVGDMSKNYGDPGKRIFFESISWAMSLSLIMYNSFSFFI